MMNRIITKLLQDEEVLALKETIIQISNARDKLVSVKVEIDDTRLQPLIKEQDEELKKMYQELQARVMELLPIWIAKSAVWGIEII